MISKRLFACALLVSCGGLALPQVGRRSAADPVDATSDTVAVVNSGPVAVRTNRPLRFAEELCAPWPGRPKLLAGATLSEPVAYLQFLEGSNIEDSAGWRCRDVEHPLACEREFHERTQATLAKNPSRWLLMERRAHFTTVLSISELNALLAPIDTLADAVLMARMAGYRLRCTGNPDLDSTGEASEGNWRLTVDSLNREILADGGQGRPRRDTLVLEVSRDGQVKEVLRIKGRP